MSEKLKVPEVQLLKEGKKIEHIRAKIYIPPPSFEASLYRNTARISFD